MKTVLNKLQATATSLKPRLFFSRDNGFWVICFDKKFKN
jgi:hypothetical protein